MISFVHRRSLAATLLGATMFLAPAVQAQSARDQVIASMVATLKATGAKDVTYAAPTGDDAKFTIRDIKATFEAEGKPSTMTAAAATYTGAKANADGGYSAAEIAIDGFAVKDDETTVSVGSWKITNYVGQSAAKAAAAKGMGDTFDRMELTSIRFAGNGPTVPIASAVMTASGHVDGVPRRGGLEVKGIVVPIDAKDPEMKEIAELGYKELALEVKAGGGWDEKTQRLSLDTLAINGKDAGTLALSFALGNVTQDSLKAMQSAAEDPAKQLEILQGYTVEQIAIRFDNASLVDRVLDARAKQAGTKREQFVTGIAAAVPLMIGALNNKAFEKKVSDAVAAFLKAPKSLAIVAKPAQPVPVAQVVGTAMVAPQTIPNVLAVDIQANQ